MSLWLKNAFILLSFDEKRNQTLKLNPMYEILSDSIIFILLTKKAL
jgi:hypothetical protein